MATVFVPTMLQTLTGGVKQVQIDGSSIRQIVNKLDEMYPGMKDRLVEEDQIRSNLAVAIDGEVARMGLLEKVGAHSEVHFVPAIGGGGGWTPDASSPHLYPGRSPGAVSKSVLQTCHAENSMPRGGMRERRNRSF